MIDLGEYGTGFTENPHPVYAELRALGPVHRVRLPPPDAHHETWLVVGYEEARAALADPRLAKDAGKIGITFLDEELIGKYLLVADPPQHTRLRSLIAREFTRGASRPWPRGSRRSPTSCSTRCCRADTPTWSSRSPIRSR